MKEDYLWDKTGEPDPKIQQLEEILGTLRYQPKPLELPQDLLAPRQRRNHFPLLAIAATVLLALLAAGIWLRVRTQSESQPNQASVAPAPPAVDEKAIVAKKNDEEVKKQKIEQVRKRGLPPLPRYTKREREEALAAKQQVMLALRLTTEKLSLVQKKTQSPSNQIKNQHRVG
ncbi:MAG TPA: hypothetical protein VK274_08840 [Pyrinomonadaceae bacterium]|nr:hypothetical protein [Pyrinomonadaceae bacterium]